MRHATLYFRYLDPAEKVVEFDEARIELRVEFTETRSKFVELLLKPSNGLLISRVLAPSIATR